MKKILIGVCCSLSTLAMAQPTVYTTANVHSHNDYEQPFPFRAAYNASFGSMEADLHLVNDTLRVAHDSARAVIAPTFEKAYLQPLQEAVGRNGGFPYANHDRTLQLLIDLKTEAVPTLDKVVATLRRYPDLTNNPRIHFVISGSRPDPADWGRYPSFIGFDGNIGDPYTEAALGRIALMSADFKKYSTWNGKGRIPQKELDTIQAAIQSIHRLGKPIRFWASPDNINAWYQLMKLKIDYLNTDHVNELAAFLNKLGRTSYRSDKTYTLYQPAYKTDGVEKKVKNVILLIGDGTGLAHWYSGYTANHGHLNVFNMRSIGLSKTSSYDNFITDSAPGATAFATGEKTNNRAVGVDHTGVALQQLPDYVAKKGMRSGLITSGDMTDATPAAFYAHRAERSEATGIFTDLAQSPVQLLMGAGNKQFTPALQQSLGKAGFTITRSVDSVPATTNGKWIVMDDNAGRSMLGGRGPWLAQAFDKAIGVLSKNKTGFFLMAEGAQVDHGGHDNNFPWLTTEVMDLDQLVGKALEFADKDGETLVIVTADHETGGLSLMDGDYGTGYIAGQFATDDHTAIPVPVFAYGPQSRLFSGVYENTAIFNKIMQALGMSVKTKQGSANH